MAQVTHLGSGELCHVGRALGRLEEVGEQPAQIRLHGTFPSRGWGLQLRVSPYTPQSPWD